MYRLNWNLPDELAARLQAYSKKTGVAKVNVVILALNSYLDEQEYKAAMLQKMSDPSTLASLLQEMGVSSEKTLELFERLKD